MTHETILDDTPFFIKRHFMQAAKNAKRKKLKEDGKIVDTFYVARAPHHFCSTLFQLQPFWVTALFFAHTFVKIVVLLSWAANKSIFVALEVAFLTLLLHYLYQIHIKQLYLKSISTNTTIMLYQKRSRHQSRFSKEILFSRGQFLHFFTRCYFETPREREKDLQGERKSNSKMSKLS